MGLGVGLGADVGVSAGSEVAGGTTPGVGLGNGGEDVSAGGLAQAEMLDRTKNKLTRILHFILASQGISYADSRLPVKIIFRQAD